MSTPAYPAGPPPTAAGAAPKEVVTAFQLFLASVVLGLIGAVLSFTLVQPVIDVQLRQAGVTGGDLGPAGQAQLESAVRAGIVVGAVVALILLALYVLFIFKMRAGRNWARIVLTVLTAISVLSTLIGFSGYSLFLQAGAIGVLYVVAVALQLVAIIVATVFMYRPAASAYFAAAR